VKANLVNEPSLPQTKKLLSSRPKEFSYIAEKFFLKVGSCSSLNFWRRLRVKLQSIKKLGLCLKEVMSERIFTTSPFQRRGSRSFFDVIKLEEETAVKSLLK
jgi:hypothetical protein